MRSGLKSIARATVLALAVLCAACGGGGGAEVAAEAGDWRAAHPVIRIAGEGDVADPASARTWDTLGAYLKEMSGVEVKHFETSDYNSRIQAISSGQLDMSAMGGGSYANVDAQVGELAAPILVVRQAEGNTGYYAAILVRSESPHQKIEDLQGKTLAYVDFNSTSGFIYPRSEMRKQGIEPDTFFGKTMMAGGHTQSALALSNGQVDAAIVNVGGGTPETGFTTGPHLSLMRVGMMKPNEVRIIWTAGPIPNSPFVMRMDRPQAMIDFVRGALAATPYDRPDVWDDIGQAQGGNFAAVNRATYQGVIDMRTADIAERRGRGTSEGGQ